MLASFSCALPWILPASSQVATVRPQTQRIGQNRASAPEICERPVLSRVR